MEAIGEKMGEWDWNYVMELLGERRIQYGILFSTVGVYVLHRMFKKRKYNMPPGPWALPVMGNLYSCRSTSFMNENFVKWRKQYGDVFTIHLGPQSFIVLASASAIREAFITKGNDFSGRMVTPSSDLFSDGGKDIAMAQPGPVWKLQRQIAHAAIRKYASGKQLETALESCFDSMITALEKEEEKVVDIPDLMQKLTYNFLATVCFGRHFEIDDPWLENFMQMVKNAIDNFGNGLISDFIPALKFLDKGKISGFLKIMNTFNEFMEKEIREHKDTFDADQPRDLTDEILLQLKKQEEEPVPNSVLSQLTRSHFLQILLDVFFAGTDTSRITLAIIIGYMAQYPEIQAKMQKELDTVLGASGGISVKMKEQLAYTNAVVHEAMRITPVAPVGVPHITTCDTSIGQYTIPKGTNVIAHAHGVHNDPENFKDPEVFNPERWLDASGKFQYQPYKFIPFSMGPRVCVGESLARADLQLFTAMLFHKYAFTPLGNEKFILPLKEIVMGIETQPYKLRLTERN